jgi:hypothetical protein
MSQTFLRNHLFSTILLAVFFLCIAIPASALAVDIERVSVASDGTEGNSATEPEFVQNKYISANGQFVVFESLSDNLVASDTNAVADIFLHDRNTDMTERISIATDGVQGNGTSFESFVSNTGEFVTFVSSANNLIPGDGESFGDRNGTTDVFLRDRNTNITEIITLAPNGDGANSISNSPRITPDGRFVVFSSNASNLVTDDLNGEGDIFLHDRTTGITDRVSVATNAAEANDFSTNPNVTNDGRFITFTSRATNLVANDTNGVDDIFVHDRTTGITQLISVALNGLESNGSSFRSYMSPDGLYVTFASEATNLVSVDTNGSFDTFLYNRTTGVTELVGPNSAGTSYVSDDGRFVTFSSSLNSIVPNDTNGDSDIFVYDRVNDVTERVSIAFDGSEANSSSFIASLSGDGEYIAFTSNATNLVLSDTNGSNDMFVALNPLFGDLEPEPTEVLSVTKDTTLRPGAIHRNEGANPHLYQDWKRRAMTAFDLPDIDLDAVTSARLVFTVDDADPAKWWGANGRTVGAHSVHSYWSEGNGAAQGLATNAQTRGDGSGTTWTCAFDSDISDNDKDCVLVEWNGGTIVAAPSDTVLHTNDMTGEISFDVTGDVNLGISSWLLKKTDEETGGFAKYFSKESGEATAPKLELVYEVEEEV